MKKYLFDIIKDASTWDDIYREFIKYNTDKDRSAGSLFEEFYHCYYRAEPSIQKEYKNVYRSKDIPPKIREKLKLASTDHGVDLILEGNDGSFSAASVGWAFKPSMSNVLTKPVFLKTITKSPLSAQDSFTNKAMDTGIGPIFDIAMFHWIKMNINDDFWAYQLPEEILAVRVLNIFARSNVSAILEPYNQELSNFLLISKVRRKTGSTWARLRQ